MIYEQSTGKLWDPKGDTLLANCYSGFGAGKNNPDLQNQIGVGPIPVGGYTIDNTVENVNVSGPHGKYVLRLHPDSNNVMYNRSGFLIHGDSIHTPGTASHGCIVTGRSNREKIFTLGDRRLQVVRSMDAIRSLPS